MFFRPLLKRIDWLHAWFGMTAGVLVLVVCWTGTIAMFLDVLEVWERTESPAAAENATLDVDAQIRDALAAYFGDVQPGYVTAFLPSSADPNLRLIASAPGMPSLNAIVAPGGAQVTASGAGPARLITRLHTDFLMPSPWGVWLVGFSGVVGLVLIVTGILLHRHIVRDLFALRLFRSRRIALHDIHTIVGTWSLPFFFLLCASGAVLGFISVASFMVSQVASEGSAEHTAAEPPSPPAPIARPAPMTDLNAVIASARRIDRPFEPEAVDVEGWGTTSAVVTVRGEPTDQLVWRRRATFDGVSGTLISPDLDAANGAPLAAYAMMTPIHYGNFGGMFVRSLYFLVGVVVTFAMGVGLVLWIDKRGASHKLLSKAAIGLSAGCLVATASLFPLDLWLRHSPEQRLSYLELSLWTSWLVAFALTVASRSWAKSLTVALAVCAVLFASAGLISTFGVLTRSGSTFGAGYATTLVNAVLIGLGVLSGCCARWTRQTFVATVDEDRAPASAIS